MFCAEQISGQVFGVAPCAVFLSFVFDLLFWLIHSAMLVFIRYVECFSIKFEIFLSFIMPFHFE